MVGSYPREAATNSQHRTSGAISSQLQRDPRYTSGAVQIEPQVPISDPAAGPQTREVATGSQPREVATGSQPRAFRGSQVPMGAPAAGPQTREAATSSQPRAPMTSPNAQPKKRSRYVASIDGLRAFAVMAVIFYHMHLGWASGGLMGVTVFFVISGYLINGLLVNECETTGRIDLPAFWMRRVRRLFPAIVLSVTGICALCTLFGPDLLQKMRPDIVPSLLFFNNWWQIFHDVSYFEAAGNPSPLQHFWSLSIEEQFYVVWPLLLLAMFAFGARQKTMRRVVAVLAVASAVGMALLYDPMGDPSRVYYGTDTRAMSLLVGAWLAFAWPSAAFGHERSSLASGTARIAANAVGVAALIGLVLIVVFTTGFSSFPYYGGIALTSVLSAALIAVLVVPDTLVDRLFRTRPLVWVGKRSYGMYLWHFPILLLTTDVNSTTGVPLWMRVVQIALIFVVSHLSYTYVEDPVRKGAVGQWWRNRNTVKAKPMRASSKVAIAVVAALVAVSAFGLVHGPLQEPSGPMPQEQAADAVQDEGPAPEEDAEADEGEDAAQDSDVQEGAPEDAAASDAIFSEQLYNDAGEPIYEPLLIGDSVAAGCESQFYEAFPCGHIDAEVARNVWESPYAAYDEAGQVGDYVVFCLGTNNAVVDWQIDDELLNVVGEDKRVFFVNTRSPQDWTDSTNQVIADIPSRHPNVVGIIDWYGASEGHDEYFAGDGTHLTEEGARAYVDLISTTVRDYAAQNS